MKSLAPLRGDHPRDRARGSVWINVSSKLPLKIECSEQMTLSPPKQITSEEGEVLQEKLVTI